MRNVRVQVAYDGSRFFGWQRQEGFESVQEAVEEALESLLGEHVTVHGSGRTDTGVHALGQVANFHVATRIPDRKLIFALNAHLPEGVGVVALETCRDDFHARYDARGKRYAYLVRTSQFQPVLGRGYTHWVPDPLDLGAMRRGAAYLVGEHDFTALASAGSPRRSNVRRIHALRIVVRKDRVAFVVGGNGFLYNMVRTLAGTLLEVGRGRRSAESVGEMIAGRDRAEAGPTAPACGLCLVRVLYDEPVFQSPQYGPRGRPGVF